MMQYPTKGAYHGIANPGDYISIERRTLSPTAFNFQLSKSTENPTTAECSISWADNDEALFVLADQVKDDDRSGGVRPHFLGGVCRVPMVNLENLRATYPDCFDYDRSPMDYRGHGGTHLNPYHGNPLLYNLQSKETKAAKKNIVSVLAWAASMPLSDVYSREELDALLEKA